MSWDVQAEKLYSHVLVDDRYAKEMSETAGDAFFRGFIVLERATGDVVLKFRFKYAGAGGDRRSWTEVRSKHGQHVTVQEAVDKLKAAVRRMLLTGAAVLGKQVPDDAVKFFDPPPEVRDSADVRNVLNWMKANDLIEVTEIKRGKKRGPVT